MSVCVAHVPFTVAGAEEQSILSELTAREAALLSPRATAKRRVEFAAGRAAARMAVRGLLRRAGPLPTAPIHILRASGTRTGKPYAQVATAGQPPELSISHVDGLAVAVASAVPVGIDLVTFESLGGGFVREAFSDAEAECWRRWGADLIQRPEWIFCFAFAAKEAALKLSAVGFATPLLATGVTPLCRSPRPKQIDGRRGLATGLRVIAIEGRESQEREIGVWFCLIQDKVMALCWEVGCEVS